MLKNSDTKPTSNYANAGIDSTAQYYHQKVLASFLQSIPHHNGWWHRLPEKTKDDKIKIRLATDTYLPHFGAIFGLTEEAMVVILAEMGLIKTFDHNNNSTIICQGWDNVKALFGVDQELEIDRSNLHLPHNGKNISKYVR